MGNESSWHVEKQYKAIGIPSHATTSQELNTRAAPGTLVSKVRYGPEPGIFSRLQSSTKRIVTDRLQPSFDNSPQEELFGAPDKD